AGEGPPLPRMGGEPARGGGAPERRPSRLRPLVRHVRLLPGPAQPRPRHREREPRGRGGGRAQQQRRLRERLRDRRAGPARPPPHHAARDGPRAPGALARPTVLITNQDSLSDAEDFTEGYRALGLGKVVGEPTAGWIIYTWNTRLIDGTVLRLPRARITDRSGAPMEMHPRPVDAEVRRPIGESYGPKDSQLD